MRVFLAIILAVAVGAALGTGLAVWRIRQAPWIGVPVNQGQTASVAPTKSASNSPRVVVDEEEYDFGVMDSNGEMSHAFHMTNVGGSPLSLTKGPTTCRCTVSEIKDEHLNPGQSTTVALTWKGRGLRGQYRQTATIYTTDPSHPEVKLLVVGRVAAAVWADPNELVLSRISHTEPVAGEVRLYCGLAERLKIVDYHFSDAALAKLFSVSVEPLPAGFHLPADARSGLLLKIAIGAGLPPGPLKQTLSLTTNLKSVPPLSLDIQGTVGSEISVAGEGWNQDLGIVSFGIVSSQAGAQRRLMLIAHGPHAKGVKFKPVEIDPDFLQVKVGETTPIGATDATQTPLIVQIPKGCRPLNRVGSEQAKLAKIVFETNYPGTPRFTVYIRFLIEGE